MFHNRHRHRRAPFADFIPWNDYRVGGMPPPLHGLGQAFGHSPWGYRRRNRLGQLLIGVAIVVAIIYLVQRLTNGRNRSAWL